MLEPTALRALAGLHHMSDCLIAAQNSPDIPTGFSTAFGRFETVLTLEPDIPQILTFPRSPIWLEFATTTFGVSNGVSTVSTPQNKLWDSSFDMVMHRTGRWNSSYTQEYTVTMVYASSSSASVIYQRVSGPDNYKWTFTATLYT